MVTGPSKYADCDGRDPLPNCGEPACAARGLDAPATARRHMKEEP